MGQQVSAESWYVNLPDMVCSPCIRISLFPSRRSRPCQIYKDAILLTCRRGQCLPASESIGHSHEDASIGLFCHGVRCGNCKLGTTAAENSLIIRIHSATKQEVVMSDHSTRKVCNQFLLFLTFPLCYKLSFSSFQKPVDGSTRLQPGAGVHLTSPKGSTDMKSSAWYLPKKQLMKRKCESPQVIEKKHRRRLSCHTN